MNENKVEVDGGTDDLKKRERERDERLYDASQGGLRGDQNTQKGLVCMGALFAHRIEYNI